MQQTPGDDHDAVVAPAPAAPPHAPPPWAPLTLVAFVALVVCTNVANVVWARWANTNPEGLLALSSRQRYLVLAVAGGISPVWYVVIGSARIAVAFVVCHFVGRAYRDQALSWFTRYLGVTQESLDVYNRGFAKAEIGLVPVLRREQHRRRAHGHPPHAARPPGGAARGRHRRPAGADVVAGEHVRSRSCSTSSSSSSATSGGRSGCRSSPWSRSTSATSGAGAGRSVAPPRPAVPQSAHGRDHVSRQPHPHRRRPPGGRLPRPGVHAHGRRPGRRHRRRLRRQEPRAEHLPEHRHGRVRGQRAGVQRAGRRPRRRRRAQRLGRPAVRPDPLLRRRGHRERRRRRRRSAATSVERTA